MPSSRFVLCLYVIILVLASAGTVYGAEVSQLPVGPGPVMPTVTVTEMPGGEQGYFLIQSYPTGSDCYFDGVFQGETPVTVAVSTTGTPSHTIRITAPGYQDALQTYNGNPRPGETITITLSLTHSPQVGNIQVTSSPSGATVSLDRSQDAVTPTTFTGIPVGTHEVSVYLAGYQTWYTSVNVQSGQTVSVNAVLSPTTTTGSLSVSSIPSGAAVYIDSLYRGTTPTIVGNLAQGQHAVRLSLAGYQDWSQMVTVSAAGTTYLNPTLTKDLSPIYGTASITTSPPGASIYANGQYIGETSAGGPLYFTQVVPGTYSILISKSGYQDYTASVQVAAGQNYDYRVTLTPVSNPKTGDIAISSSPSDANVYVNNAYKGLSPITLEGLSPGSYTVMLQLSGYQDWQAGAQVTAGQTTQLTATLNPTATPTPTKSGPGPLLFIGALGLTGILVLRRRKI